MNVLLFLVESYSRFSLLLLPLRNERFCFSRMLNSHSVWQRDLFMWFYIPHLFLTLWYHLPQPPSPAWCVPRDIPFCYPLPLYSHLHPALLSQHLCPPLGLGPISSFPLYSKLSSICVGSQSLVPMVITTLYPRRSKSLHVGLPVVKNPSANAKDTGSILVQEDTTCHSGPLSPCPSTTELVL